MFEIRMKAFLSKAKYDIIKIPKSWQSRFPRFGIHLYPVTNIYAQHNPQPGWSTQHGLSVYRAVLRYFPRVAEHYLSEVYFKAVVAAIRERQLKFDLIHAHWAYRSGYVASLLGKQFQKPFILSVWGSDINQWLHEPTKRNKTLQALNGAQAIISNSKALCQKLLHENIPGTKVHTITQGVDLHRFVNSNSKIASTVRSRFCKGAFIYSCIANHYHVKGIDVLLQALKNTDDNIAAVLIGDGPERESLEKFTLNLGVESRVWFAGKKENHEIPDWMNAADALVLPSRSEGLPTVLLENMACGKPFVATDVGGIKAVLQDEHLGMITPSDDPSALASALAAAAYKTWDGEVIRKRALHFSEEKLVPKIEELYQMRPS